MKVVRRNGLFDQEYRVYPFLKPDDNVSAFLPQYISVICEYGDVTVTSNFSYVDEGIERAAQYLFAWRKVRGIEATLQVDYEAEIVVDEVVEREAQS